MKVKCWKKESRDGDSSGCAALNLFELRLGAVLVILALYCIVYINLYTAFSQIGQMAVCESSSTTGGLDNTFRQIAGKHVGL